MSKLSKTQRRWLIGCLGAMGFLVLLGSMLLIAFFRFMDGLNKVPPESTQITLVNATNERVQIDRFVFGKEVIIDNDVSYLDEKKPDTYTWYLYRFYRDQPEMERNISVTYTGMKSRETWQAQGIALRVSDRPCRFVVLLRPGGGQVSSCVYNELQDFERD